MEISKHILMTKKLHKWPRNDEKPEEIIPYEKLPKIPKGKRLKISNFKGGKTLLRLSNISSKMPDWLEIIEDQPIRTDDVYDAYEFAIIEKDLGENDKVEFDVTLV